MLRTYILPHLVNNFNACLTLHYFPASWRCARALVLKKANKESYVSAGSFRPISILNALSKLFERVVHARLRLLVESNKWFSPARHGFRPRRSTESACIELISLIEESFRQRKIVACAFLDIKSAFDAAWHPAILRGLIAKGCPSYLAELVRCFLHDRSATLSSADASLTRKLELGCPQGSVLSPFLWNILLDSLLRENFPFPHLFIAYADDVVLCSVHEDRNVAISNLQRMCDTAVSWGEAVKHSFNPSKSAFLLFSRKRKKDVDVDVDLFILLNQDRVHRSRDCLYLGITIDEA